MNTCRRIDANTLQADAVAGNAGFIISARAYEITLKRQRPWLSIFYRTNDTYGGFSNFSRHAIFLDGAKWPTTEHYFQAQKFLDKRTQEKIRLRRTPREAADLGRDRSLPLRADWEEVKDDVMRKAVEAKFTQHEELTELLLSTGDEELIEQTTNDYYWGCGTNGGGKNMLGVILMEVREKLKQKS